MICESLLDDSQERSKLRAELRLMSYADYLESTVWKLFRQEILKRDGYKCAHCEATTDLEIHHHHYETVRNELPRDVITLCGACHEKEEAWIKENGRRWKPSLLQERTPNWFEAREDMKRYGWIVNPNSRAML